MAEVKSYDFMDDDDLVTDQDKEAIMTASRDLNEIGRTGGIIEEFDENL